MLLSLWASTRPSRSLQFPPSIHSQGAAWASDRCQAEQRDNHTQALQHPTPLQDVYPLTQTCPSPRSTQSLPHSPFPAPRPVGSAPCGPGTPASTGSRRPRCTRATNRSASALARARGPFAQSSWVVWSCALGGRHRSEVKCDAAKTATKNEARGAGEATRQGDAPATRMSTCARGDKK